jgi:hypothetical protein
MYYYIFDLKKCKKPSVATEIKDYLNLLGIAGEFTYPTTAHSVDELVDLGLSKKYNTIVAIGDDEIANRVAAKLCGRQEAMGIIPLEASEELQTFIGAKNWKEAAENVRFRKIAEIKIGKTANGNAFLTDLKLGLKGPTEVTIEFRDFLVKAKVAELIISNYNPNIEKISPDYLDVVLQSVSPEQNIFSKVSSFFGMKKELNKSLSLFRGRSLRLFTSSQIPLISGNAAIAKTPQLVESSDENLRLIIGKKSPIKT